MLIDVNQDGVLETVFVERSGAELRAIFVDGEGMVNRPSGADFAIVWGEPVEAQACSPLAYGALGDPSSDTEGIAFVWADTIGEPDRFLVHADSVARRRGAAHAVHATSGRQPGPFPRHSPRRHRSLSETSTGPVSMKRSSRFPTDGSRSTPKRDDGPRRVGPPSTGSDAADAAAVAVEDRRASLVPPVGARPRRCRRKRDLRNRALGRRLLLRLRTQRRASHQLASAAEAERAGRLPRSPVRRAARKPAHPGHRRRRAQRSPFPQRVGRSLRVR